MTLNLLSYMDQDKTIKIIKSNVFWVGIDKFIEDFVYS
jgi:hypothetical protein